MYRVEITSLSEDLFANQGYYLHKIQYHLVFTSAQKYSVYESYKYNTGDPESKLWLD